MKPKFRIQGVPASRKMIRFTVTKFDINNVISKLLNDKKKINKKAIEDQLEESLFKLGFDYADFYVFDEKFDNQYLEEIGKRYFPDFYRK